MDEDDCHSTCAWNEQQDTQPRKSAGQRGQIRMTTKTTPGPHDQNITFTDFLIN